MNGASLSLRRIALLTRMQAKDHDKRRAPKTKGRKAVAIAERVGFFLILSGAMVGILYLFKALAVVAITPPLLAFSVVLVQLISIVSCIGGLIDALFLAKDNPILLSFPAKHFEVFLSKLIIYYIQEFRRNLAALTPFLVAYGVFTGQGGLYWLGTLLSVILLPLVPVLLGALLSYPVMMVKKLFTQSNLLTALVFVALFGLLIWGFFALLEIIPNPLRILSNYATMTRFFAHVLDLVYRNALFLRWFVLSLVGPHAALNALWFILSLVGLALLVGVITSPRYYGLTSQGKSGRIRKSSQKKEQGKGTEALHSTFLAFFTKECKLQFRHVSSLIANYILLFVLPFMLLFLNACFANMNLRPDIGRDMVLTALLLVSLLLALGSNTASATAISEEGSEFALLKTAPSDTATMAWAKIAFNLIASFAVITLAFVILLFDRGALSALEIIGLWFVVIVIDSAHILLSFEIDLMHPHILDVAASGTTENSPNITRSISWGFAIALLTSALACLLFMDSYVSGWIRLIIIALAFLASRLYLFSRKLAAYFADLEA